MRLFSLRRAWVLGVLFFSLGIGNAQFLRTSYFMEGSHYRQQLNPALAPGRGYLNLPVIGSFSASVNSSSLGYQDVMDIIDNSEDGDFFMSDAFINRLENNNNLNVNLSTDILSAGWYKGKNFWSFNIGLRNDIGASIPRSMFKFLRSMDGLADNLDRLASISESVDKQSLEINSFAEVGVGLSRNINSRLTVGGRVKALLGIGNLKLNINGITVESQIDGVDNIDWDNFDYEQLQGVSGSASINVDATLENSSKMIELPQNEDGYIDEIEFGSFGFAGYGAAIDLGVSYKLTNKLTLSASVLDLGFIKWGKNNTSVATAKANQNYDLTNPSDLYDFVDVVSSGEVLNYDMLQMEVDDTAEKSRTSSLTSTVVVGAEYELLGDWLAVGALYTARFAKPETLNELTLSANIRPKNNLNLAVSYSLLQGAGKTFGLAAKLGPLFVGTDYMFLGKNSKNLNAYLGISIPLAKQKSSKD